VAPENNPQAPCRFFSEVNMKKKNCFLRAFLYFRSVWRWSKKGQSWPWILILTGLAGGIISALAKWISKMNPPPGGP